MSRTEASQAAAVDFDLLCDPRYGIVTALVNQPPAEDIPTALDAVLAHVTDSARLGEHWMGDRIAFGSAFNDPEQARRAAIGEAVERYCGNFIPTGLHRASFNALKRKGQAAVDPADLILYADWQYREAGFPFVPFAPDLEVNWTLGQDMLSGEDVLVPASVVYINYYSGRLADEPCTNFVMYSGIAAGRGREDAERSALEELLERDATMIWWLSGSPARGIEFGPDHDLRPLLNTEGDSRHLEFHLIALPTPFDVPVLGAMLHDTRNRTIGLGVACRPDPRAAARKALIEAIQLRGYALGLLDPEGSVWTAMRRGILDSRVYKPYRADRRYGEDFRADFRDITDLGTQSQYYLDPSTHHHARRILEPSERIALDALPTVSGDPRTAYLERLATRGLRAISVDLTTPDVAQSGLRVVRVLVPGLYPNAPAAFPFLGGKRLYEEPARMGWLPTPLGRDDLILAPLPHT